MIVKYIGLSLIPGVMVGFEWDHINGFVVFDLFILRIVFDYRGFDV